MSYLNFLKKELPQEWIVTDEVNINWNGNDITAILKSLSGTIFRDSTSIPIQIVVLTPKPLEDKSILDQFVARNHNSYYIDGINTYVKQQYLSPIVPVVATPTGSQLMNQIILTGTLLRSDNVSDINEVYIDGELQGISDAALGMSTDAEANVKIFGARDPENPQISKTTVKKGTINLEFSLVNKNNAFCNALKQMRTGLKDLDTIFNVELHYTDDSIEKYQMKVTSHTVSPSIMALPVTKVTMSCWKVGV